MFGGYHPLLNKDYVCVRLKDRSLLALFERISMKVVTSLPELRISLKAIDKEKILGFVPTMGALHDGHLRLVNESKKNSDVTIVSIFVNPTQFNNTEDLDQYPNRVETDLKKLEIAGVNIVFTPDRDTMYPVDSTFSFDLKHWNKTQEGLHRPGHFNGVLQVVLRFFNLIQPHKAFFGKKDLQQFLLIRRVSEELHYRTTVIGVDTVREPSGLAMSSRNLRLSEGARLEAANIYAVLTELKYEILNGTDLEDVLALGRNTLSAISGFELEYLEACDAANFLPVSQSTREVAVCVSCHVEGVRLIDNVLIVQRD